MVWNLHQLWGETSQKNLNVRRPKCMEIQIRTNRRAPFTTRHRLKICGTPSFSAPSLEEIWSSHRACKTTLHPDKKRHNTLTWAGKLASASPRRSEDERDSNSRVFCWNTFPFNTIQEPALEKVSLDAPQLHYINHHHPLKENLNNTLFLGEKRGWHWGSWAP